MLNGVSPLTSPLAELRPILKRSSVNLANLEIPLTDVGKRTSHKKPADVKARRQFVLRASPAQAHWIRDAGFDGVCLGNNHAMDYGADGLSRMEQSLIAANIGYTGAGTSLPEARRVIVKTLQSGLRVGMISALAFATPKALYACTPATATSAGVNPFDPKEAAAWIAEAHRSCDVLIVALHGGVERKIIPNANQHRFAHLCIDAGADVVWGHHPHVLEGAELYKGHPILYSMGNLVSSLPSSTGLVRLKFKGTQFVSSQFVACQISRGKLHVLPSKLQTARSQQYRKLNTLGRQGSEVALPISPFIYPGY